MALGECFACQRSTAVSRHASAAKNGASATANAAALASGLAQMDAPPQTPGSNCPAIIRTGTRIAELAPEVSTALAVLSSAVVTVSFTASSSAMSRGSGWVISAERKLTFRDPGAVVQVIIVEAPPGELRILVGGNERR